MTRRTRRRMGRNDVRRGRSGWWRARRARCVRQHRSRLAGVCRRRARLGAVAGIPGLAGSSATARAQLGGTPLGEARGAPPERSFAGAVRTRAHVAERSSPGARGAPLERSSATARAKTRQADLAEATARAKLKLCSSPTGTRAEPRRSPHPGSAQAGGPRSHQSAPRRARPGPGTNEIPQRRPSSPARRSAGTQARPPAVPAQGSARPARAMRPGLLRRLAAPRTAARSCRACTGHLLATRRTRTHRGT